MTPAPQVPQPPQVQPQTPGLLSLLGPLIGGFLGPQGSGRRLLFGAVGAAAIALNHRLGLNLDFNEQSLLAGVVLGIVAASNTKEALVQRAQMAGQTAVFVAEHQAKAAVAVAQAGAAAAPAADDAPPKEG